MTNINRALSYAGLLGIAHAVADAVTGFAIAVFALTSPINAVTTIVVYNFIAFALQPAFGFLIDRHGWHHPSTVTGLVTMAVGLVAFPFNAPVALIIIAIGSSVFHVGAGALSAKLTPMKAIGPGFFTAPGVFGLAVGTVAGLSSVPLLLPLIVLLTVATIGVIMIRVDGSRASKGSTHGSTPTAVIAGSIIVLAIAVGFRSAGWSAVGHAYPTIVGIIALGAGAMIGKLLGGIIADKLGWATTAFFGTALAGICFLFPACLPATVLGVLLLQSSTPIVLAALVNAAP